MQGEHQVELPDVARVAKLGSADFREVQVAENIQPVVDGHHDHVAFPTQAGAIIKVFVDRAVVVGAAMKIDQHGALPPVAQGRCPDIELQAILTRARRDATALRRHRPEGLGVAHTRPRHGRHRRLETMLGRVVPVRDAFEHADAAIVDEAAHLAGGRAGHRILAGHQLAHPNQQQAQGPAKRGSDAIHPGSQQQPRGRHKSDLPDCPGSLHPAPCP